MKNPQNPFNKRPALAGAGVVVTLGLAVALLYNTTSAKAEAPMNGDAPIQQVDVINIQPKPIRVWNSFSGRITAVDNVQVRPRVGGTITKVLFEDGQVVEKGDPLFVIDTRPYESQVATAQAALASAKSQKDLAYSELLRAKKLLENKHISESLVDSRRRDFQVANSAIDSAKAALRRAELDLEYAHIAAPVSGQISRAEITEGNVIEAGPNAPVLTTIVSNDKFYAEFDVDEQTYINSVRSMRSGEMPVEMRLNSAGEVSYKGVIDSFDNRLDTTSGTIRARAIFTNDDGALLPGLYANIRLGSAGKERLILIPERAISTDQDKKFVYTLSANNIVEYREVKPGKSLEGKREILSGLSAGDVVMVNSLQRVRPGDKVKPFNSAQTSDEGAEAPQTSGELAQKDDINE